MKSSPRHSTLAIAMKLLPPRFKKVPPFWAGTAVGCLGALLLTLLCSVLVPGSHGPAAFPLLSPQALRFPSHTDPAWAPVREGAFSNPPQRWNPSFYKMHIRKLERAVRRHAAEDVRARCLSIIRGEAGSLGPFGKTGSFAQAGQDWLLFHNYFFHVPYGAGVYLDVGSNHPEHFSNTYFFDRCLGWRGVCVEPNPKYHALYARHNRSCTLVKACVSDHEGTVGMTLQKGLHGKLVPTLEGPQVQCTTLERIVEDHKLSYADLATIDIEGLEMSALRCFPFRAHRISTWLVETDKAQLNLFRLFLRGGYGYVADILCPLRALHSDRTRVGVKLDSVFRLLTPAFIPGPSFLPRHIWDGLGPRGPCKAWSKGEEQCPEQVPVLEANEVNPDNMTLRLGACGLPANGQKTSDFFVPTADHPAIYRN